MNSCPNSDSKRCPESKLGHVHSVHTLGPSSTHATSTLRRVAGLALPCRRLGPAVPLCPLTHWHAVSQAVCCTPCRASYRRTGRHVAHRIVAQGAVSRAYSAVSWSLPRPCRACLVIQPGSQAPRVAADRISSGSAMSWPVSTFIVAALACTSRSYRGLVPLLCHDTMHCIVTQAGKKMGSSPFQLLHFFFPFDLLEDYQKKKKTSFCSRTKNIFLNFFFPVLHTVKPRKIFLNTHFFPFNS